MKLITCLAMMLMMVQADIPLSVVDHEDPNYWDVCLEVTGVLCEFCCLTDQAACS